MTVKIKKGDRLRCVDMDTVTITNGKIYIAEADAYTSFDEGFVRVKNDRDMVGTYYISRFELVEEAPAPKKDFSYTVQRENGRMGMLIVGDLSQEQIDAIVAVLN